MNVRRRFFASCRSALYLKFSMVNSIFMSRGAKDGAIGNTRDHVDSGRMNGISSFVGNVVSTQSLNG
jgi:hypothetical protein